MSFQQAQTALATSGSQSSHARGKKEVASTSGRKRKNQENSNVVKEKKAKKK